MTTDVMQHLFERHFDDEHLKFDRVQNKRSNRPDIHAFLLLDSLVPGTQDMVASSWHDEIALDVDPETVALAATEDHVIELIRCGVRCDGGSFQMFV